MQVTQGNVLSNYRKFNQIAQVTSTKLQRPVIRAMTARGNEYLQNPELLPNMPEDKKYLPKQIKEICILRAIQENVPRDPTLRKRLEARIQYILENHTEEQIIEQQKKDGVFDRPVEPIVDGPIDKEFFIKVYKELVEPVTKIKAKKFNENTLIKFVSRSNKFYHEKASHYAEDESVQKACAVLMEVVQDIKDIKAVEKADQLLQEHYSDMTLYSTYAVPHGDKDDF